MNTMRLEDMNLGITGRIVTNPAIDLLNAMKWVDEFLFQKIDQVGS